MLMAILRELPLSDGSADVNGRLAYVSQQPWVFSASLRQNIIFGNEFKQDRYNEIVEACALDKVGTKNKILTASTYKKEAADKNKKI